MKVLDAMTQPNEHSHEQRLVIDRRRRWHSARPVEGSHGPREERGSEVARRSLDVCGGGLSIAMGNAASSARRSACKVNTSNEEERFADAVERYVP